MQRGGFGIEYFFSMAFVVLFSTTQPVAQEPPASKTMRLGAGVNFGNMLDAPQEGEWGLKVNDRFFAIVKRAGFDHVRLPISWTGHAGQTPPFRIEESFFRRVESLIQEALAADLKILINDHHHDSLDADPAQAEERFAAMWEQIAARFAKMPPTVLFEIRNEPHGRFSEEPEVWNRLAARVLQTIRNTNPTRTVVIGPVDYNNIPSLSSLKLPKDPYLLATVHYYDPRDFTHQGAPWAEPVLPKGVPWIPNAKWLSGGWQNWSWDAELKPGLSGLNAKFTKGWGGVNLHSAVGHPLPSKVLVETNQALPLKLILKAPSKTLEIEFTTRADVVTEIEVNGKANGSEFEFQELALQLMRSQASEDFELRQLNLVYADGSVPLLATSADIIRADLKAAADWGKKHNVPIYLGEFGAYEEADMASRERWTEAVRTSAEELGMDWAYWEFASGFGIYDPGKASYREGLLRALVPK